MEEQVGLISPRVHNTRYIIVLDCYELAYFKHCPTSLVIVMMESTKEDSILTVFVQFLLLMIFVKVLPSLLYNQRGYHITIPYAETGSWLTQYLLSSIVCWGLL